MRDPRNTFSLGGSLVKVLCPVLSPFVKHFTSTQTHDMYLENILSGQNLVEDPCNTYWSGTIP